MPAWALSRLLLIVFVATCARPAHAEERLTGTIRGVQMVNVRSGPGTEHSAIRALREGSEVEVQSIQDTWARIRLPDGQVGYVNSAFLQLRTGPGEVPQQGPATPQVAVATLPARRTPAATEPVVATRVATTATPRQAPRTPTIEPVAPPTATGTPTEPVRAESPQAPPPEAPIGRVADRGPPSGSDEADLRRVLRLTEEVHREVVGRHSGPPAATSDAPGVASTLALTGAGLVIGFLIGTVSGRYQERNRRNRVRF